uniref:Uncharacterized protein n=1 Tax=Rhabditophanes sp. KR3021 TaxID=114890 RepID=A0AC35UI39_9BILA
MATDHGIIGAAIEILEFIEKLSLGTLPFLQTITIILTHNHLGPPDGMEVHRHGEAHPGRPLLKIVHHGKEVVHRGKEVVHHGKAVVVHLGKEAVHHGRVAVAHSGLKVVVGK